MAHMLSSSTLDKYLVLRDPQKRATYGQYGEEGLKGQVSPTGAGGFSGMPHDGGSASFRFNPRNADDEFTKFFGFSGPFGGMGGSHLGRGMFSEDILSYLRWAAFGGGRGGEGSASMPPRKTTMIEHTLFCSLEDLFKGTTKKMKLCRDVFYDTGRPTTEEKILAIEIRPGWKKGTKITVTHEQLGVTPIKVVFMIDEKPHHVFKRDGDDLVVTQKLSVAEALAGYTAHISTLDGRSLTVPVNNVIGRAYEQVVKGEGMPIPEDPTKKGDLRIKFDIS